MQTLLKVRGIAVAACWFHLAAAQFACGVGVVYQSDLPIDDEGDGKQDKAASYSLKLKGDTLQTLQSGQSRMFEVSLTDAASNPVVNQPIVFALVGDAKGSSLSATQAVTDQQGQAGVMMIAGGEASQFQLKASGPNDAGSVAFNIQVVAAVRNPSIVFVPAQPAAGESVQVKVSATTGYTQTDLIPSGPCGSIPFDFLGETQDQPTQVRTWTYKLTLVAGGSYSFSFVADEGQTLVISGQLQVSGSAACPEDCSNHCSNGKKDCGETGTDCGGECAACADHCLGKIDVLDYVVPDCANGGPNNLMSNGEQFQTRTFNTASSKGFYFIKSSDGQGFEEWTFDDQYLRIRRDTTWAYQSGNEWCDMTCGASAGCFKRWQGDSADWAATRYQARGDPAQAAPWYKRCVTSGETFSTDFTVAAVRLSSCEPCTSMFTGDSSHTVLVAKLDQWHGINDVLQMSISVGGGAGESYFYAKGRGWIGFTSGGTETFATATGSDVLPNDGCSGYQLGSVCE